MGFIYETEKKKEILVTESSAISNCSLPLTLGERQSQERKKKKKNMNGIL